MSKLVIIDADSMLYISATDSVAESLERFNSLLTDICVQTNATHVFLVVSTGPYYRHAVNKEYKNNRGSVPPKYIQLLKDYAISEFGAFSIPLLEADDIVTWIYNEYEFDGEKQLAVIDKDIIKQTPGTHYNYKKREFITTTEDEAELFSALQILTGDSGDNIKGLPGIGPVKAVKMLEGIASSDYYSKVLSLYVDHYKDPYLGSYYYQQNLRQILLLNSSPRILIEIGSIPTLPEPNKIIHGHPENDDF